MEQEPAGRRAWLETLMRRRPVIAAAVLAAVGLLILVVILRGRPQHYISLSGIIEATEVTLSSKVTAKVAAVYVSESDKVRKGETLVRLRDTEFREQVRQAEAALEAAQARLNEALAGTRPEEIRQARAQLEQAEAAVTGARRSLSIAEEAFQESRELRARLEAAESHHRASSAAYQRAQEALRLVKQGARVEQVEQARAAVRQAEARDNQAREDLRRARELFGRGAIPANQLDAAEAAAESARAQLDQAIARLSELEAGARPEEIREAEAAAQQAEAVMSGAGRALEIAREQYQERLQERQQLTTARTQYETALAQRRAAEARLQELLAGARPEQIEQLRAQVRQAEAALAQARTQLENTIVQSPIDGTVLTQAVEPGELATVGSTLIVLADLRQIELEVYVEEPVYGRIRLAQPATVTVDSYPNQVFRGRVTEIAEEAEFTPKEIQTKEQRAKLVFAVKITVPNPAGKLKPGMPADAVLGLQPVAGRASNAGIGLGHPTSI
ncbi:MAG TPA: efflux RND transporter periplasmic adaptor subunit [Armatimonadota bacterium]|nr:efflux RND transporter periplasmic adaptor subunit [Armatimonadota bacterium]